MKLNSGASYPYGFGWALKERAGKPLHQHTGSWQGFVSVYSRFLGDELSIVNPTLAVPPLAPIPDGEPAMTARFRAMLEQLRNGTLDPADFAYVPSWFFPALAWRRTDSVAQPRLQGAASPFNRSPQGARPCVGMCLKFPIVSDKDARRRPREVERLPPSHELAFTPCHDKDLPAPWQGFASNGGNP
ncbi:hypothetical protein [Corallococcus sp. CA054B]|uniref:hypothetical protein n=1 Tax=Corallococcus sp. CA054B TaxID=2316734 RepID=UPI001F27CD92|nr:hypothetical protein [Corallococcus sp. CA054B]